MKTSIIGGQAGRIGILSADPLLGEVIPSMAAAVGQKAAPRSFFTGKLLYSPYPAQEALPMNYAYDIIARSIEQTLPLREHLILAIDGRCASGKTTLAGRLSESFNADVIHMDDFFLPLSLRTPKRLAEPGGNVHYERFLTQIIKPLLQDGMHPACPENSAPVADLTAHAPLPRLFWERFDCSCGLFAPELCRTSGQPVLIIEGAYSMRQEFRAAYDLSFFLTVDADVQKQRILARNGAERWPAFQEKWIPMEERYFSACQIESCCQMTLEG